LERYKKNNNNQKNKKQKTKKTSKMSTIRERFSANLLFEAVKIYMKQSKNWDKFTSFLRKLELTKRIGNESKYGKIFHGYFKYSERSSLCVKLIPMCPLDLEFMLNEERMNHKTIFESKTVWKEIYVLRLCMKLLKLKKSIHLPIHYFCLYSNNHDFLKDYTQEQPHLFVLNELASDDLKNWAKHGRSVHEWISCFLQIFFGLYVLQYYCGILHNDLHWANVLVFPIEKGGCWCYHIQSQSYYIENHGYLFVLWDFGMSTYNASLIRGGNDPKACQDFLKILNTPKWIQKYYSNVNVPFEIISMCQTIRSHSYSNMNELLHQVIRPLSYNLKELTLLESFAIHEEDVQLSSFVK